MLHLIINVLQPHRVTHCLHCESCIKSLPYLTVTSIFHSRLLTQLFTMADISQTPPLTRPSVIAAHALIKKHIHYTPVLTNTTISSLASTPQTADALRGTPWEGQEPANPTLRLWFKCENLQKVGAFKVRGAFHALTRLMAQEGWEENGGRVKGVVTHSSGSSSSSHPGLAGELFLKN